MRPSSIRPSWQQLGHLQTREVSQVLERAVRRIEKHLRGHGVLETLDPNTALEDPDAEARRTFGARMRATIQRCARHQIFVGTLLVLRIARCALSAIIDWRWQGQCPSGLMPVAFNRS